MRMSFATANMEASSKDAPAPQAPIVRRAPWLQDPATRAQQHPLLAMHPPGSATGAPSSLMKQLHFGRPAWPVSAEPQHLASVDMLVLPETAPAVQTKTATDGPAEVKVTFSSAEDMAEALFSAKAKTHENAGLESLYTHKDMAHEALLEHKGVLRSLHKHKTLVHDALLDHRDQIRDIDSGLVDHQQHLQRLCEFESGTKSRLATVSAEVKALQKQVEKLNQDAGNFHSGLKTHTRVLEEHAGTLKSHSRLHDNVSKLSQSLGGASAAVESRVRDLQQSLKETQTQLQALKPRTVALDQQKKVDIVISAPRRRG
jgi:predicted  nucleic acid-binding Zn-ribbon protein